MTDAMLEQSPYAPFTDPAQNIAERLVMLTHRTFNAKMWGSASGRAERYWPGMTERLELTSGSVDDLAEWWGLMISEIKGMPLRSTTLLHEKNLLCHPTTLPVTQVKDQDVLLVLQRYTLDLVDRTRIWVRVSREARNAAALAREAAAEDAALTDNDEYEAPNA